MRYTKTEAARLTAALGELLGKPKDGPGSFQADEYADHGYKLVESTGGGYNHPIPIFTARRPLGEFCKMLGAAVDLLEISHKPAAVAIDAPDYNGWHSWESWYVSSVLDNEADLYDLKIRLKALIIAGVIESGPGATGNVATRAIANLYSLAHARANLYQRRGDESPVILSGADWLDLADSFWQGIEESRNDPYFTPEIAKAKAAGELPAELAGKRKSR
jgi:hypothetical protein